jgi:hypothetical protein
MLYPPVLMCFRCAVDSVVVAPAPPWQPVQRSVTFQPVGLMRFGELYVPFDCIRPPSEWQSVVQLLLVVQRKVWPLTQLSTVDRCP